MRDWWTEADNKAYKQKTARLVAQFSAYEVLPGLKANGELTLGENIDDLTGLTISYRAYQKAFVGAPAPVIDGLTGDERFFMGWAHVCGGRSSATTPCGSRCSSTATRLSATCPSSTRRSTCAPTTTCSFCLTSV